MDNDVLFREGLTLKGEVTYTPRLLSLDLQGSLGLLPQCGVEGWRVEETPISMSVSRLTTVNINQVLALPPITRMAFLLLSLDPWCLVTRAE